MDKLKELLERIPYGLLLAAYLGYLGFSFYKFSYSAESPKAERQVELDQLKKETDEIAAKIKSANEFYKSLDQKRVELRGLAQQLDEMRASLTEQIDIAYFLKMVVTEATKVGLSVVSIRPTTTKSAENGYYAEQSFELTFRAVFVQLLVFLERMSTVERIVRIESLDASVSGSSSAPYVELSGRLELKAYRYIGTKADQLGKPEDSAGAKPAAAGGT